MDTDGVLRAWSRPLYRVTVELGWERPDSENSVRKQNSTEDKSYARVLPFCTWTSPPTFGSTDPVFDRRDRRPHGSWTSNRLPGSSVVFEGGTGTHVLL